MNKEENRIVPQLRFPEFENSKEWKKKPFSKLFKIGSGRDYKHLDKGEIPVYGTGGYMLSVNDYLYDGKSACIGRKGTINKPIFLTGKFWTVDTLFYTYSFKDCSPEFIYLLFQNINWLNYNEAGGIPSLSKVIIYKIEVYVPKPEEQEKIVKVITSLDNLITAETEKLDLLKDHKKGLLQQLFPAEGETQPKFRFSEFKNDGDWEEKVIDDCFDVCSSKRVLQKDWIQDGVPFYRTRELVSLSKNEPFGSEIFISESLFQKLSKNYGVPKKGDFLVSGVGTLGIIYQVKESDKFYFKDGNVIWFKIGNNISSDYFKHCFETQFVQNQIFGQSSASTVGTYTITNARKTKFWKPIRKEEQQKIADFLSAIDALIEIQELKIEKLQDHKKGLLQQLFPNVNELTI